MLQDSLAFSGFSVLNMAATQHFYQDVLGLQVEDNGMGLVLKTGGNKGVFVYAKPDHIPASFTILNFPVEDIDQTVSELKAKGVVFEQYEGLTDETGIARGISANRGPDIAWFKDPSGNILSVLHEA